MYLHTHTHSDIQNTKNCCQYQYKAHWRWKPFCDSILGQHIRRANSYQRGQYYFFCTHFLTSPSKRCKPKNPNTKNLYTIFRFFILLYLDSVVASTMADFFILFSYQISFINVFKSIMNYVCRILLFYQIFVKTIKNHSLTTLTSHFARGLIFNRQVFISRLFISKCGRSYYVRFCWK